MRIASCITLVQALLLTVLLADCTATSRAPAAPVAGPVIATCFVPGTVDCASVIDGVIGDAHRTLDIQAYNFTEPGIAAAIIAAKQRGVQVRLLVDKTAPSERGEMTDDVAKSGVSVWVDYRPHIAHNKVMVIDGQTVIGGSFNYTASADQHNAENVTIIRDIPTAQAFEQNFESRLAASETLAAYKAR